MLFSQPRVAAFITRHFEPAWESLRPVPLLHIDFGNGRVVTRTLHGNILTSVCTPDGLVYDALPGIYTEAVYLGCLDYLRQFATGVARLPASQRGGVVRDYHQRQMRAIQAVRPPVPGQGAASLYIGKSIIEMPIETVARLRAVRPAGLTVQAAANDTPPLRPEDLRAWKALEEDTRLNEGTRRLQIHAMLAAAGLVRPEKVVRPIYRDVLHADLEDPYLGLGKILLDGDPFARDPQR